MKRWHGAFGKSGFSFVLARKNRRMIMKTYWWKIGGVFLLLAAVIIAAVFWPRQEQDNKTDSAVGPMSEQTQRDRRRLTAEELYQRALFYKESDDSPARNYRIVVDCCRQILNDYPSSPQAEKARELLQESRQRYEGWLESQMSNTGRSEPKVKKSRPLRRGRLPHYHRRGPGGIGEHRPWEKGRF
jgi:cytoskeletal protein RodZ